MIGSALALLLQLGLVRDVPRIRDRQIIRNCGNVEREEAACVADTPRIQGF